VQGNPLSCVKTFGTKGCKLCNKERWAILNLTRKYPNLAINKSNEIYGACRHKPKFHRFTRRQNDASTDETEKVERVTGRPNSTTSQASTSSTATFESCDKRGEDVLPIQILLLPSGLRLTRNTDWRPGSLIDPGYHTEVESNLEEPPQDYPGEDGIGTDLPLGDELAVDD
jgi:hypothetical protein